MIGAVARNSKCSKTCGRKRSRSEPTALRSNVRTEPRLVSAFCGPAGVGIAWLDAVQWDVVYEQMKKMKKTRRTVLDGASYRLAFSKYQSFGERVFVIRIREVK